MLRHSHSVGCVEVLDRRMCLYCFVYHLNIERGGVMSPSMASGA